jgi:uncharacterized NAD(P)/FAD-binding protein YdhS
MTPRLSKPSLAIVGGGASGTLVAIHLLKRAPRAFDLHVIEPRPALGAGLAYSTSCPDHFLNVPAGKMSAYPDQPDHFLAWARARPEGGDLSGSDFLPRSWFRVYLQELFDGARAAAPEGTGFTHWRQEAVEIVPSSPDGGEIRLKNGQAVRGDRVVLALGNLPSQYPIFKPLSFYHSSRYIHFPWDPARIAAIGPDEPVLLIGQGLSSIDILLQLAAQGHRAPIHAVSRRGLEPCCYEPADPYPCFLRPEAAPASIRELVRLIRGEVRKAKADGIGWRPVLDSLRPVTPELWKRLPVPERARFLRHLRPYWEIHRHRVAPQVSRKLRELKASGQLRRYAGRLADLSEESGAALVQVRLAGSSTPIPLRVAHVINCTGPRSDFSKFEHPLMVSLLAGDLMYHDPLALGMNADAEGVLVNYQGKRIPWLWTLGPPLKGMLWETTAIPEIRVQAAKIADRLLEVI